MKLECFKEIELYLCWVLVSTNQYVSWNPINSNAHRSCLNAVVTPVIWFLADERD